MADIKSLGDQLVELTVKEVNELASYLKETRHRACCCCGLLLQPAAGGGDAAAENQF